MLTFIFSECYTQNKGREKCDKNYKSYVVPK